MEILLPSERTAKFRRGVMIAAGLALLVSMGGAIADPTAFFRAYLVGWVYLGGFALGSLTIWLLHNLTGGNWGQGQRGLLKAAAWTLPLLIVLALPLLLGLGSLYPWLDEAAVKADAVLERKQAYLNLPFFLGRNVAYFLLWCGSLLLLEHTEKNVRRSSTLQTWRRFRLTSGQAMGLHGLAVTFAAVDWCLSLEPHWYSSMYGVIFFVGQALSALALVTFLAALAVMLPAATPGPQHPAEQASPDGTSVRSGAPGENKSPPALRDLGTLLFAATLIWSYVAFCQYLIMWYGSLPEDIEWYARRGAGGWRWLVALLLVFHFALPLAALLAPAVRDRPQALASIAGLLLLARWLDVLWLIQPAFEREYFYIPWLDLATSVLVGGVWLLAFFWLLARGRHEDRVLDDSKWRRIEDE